MVPEIQESKPQKRNRFNLLS